MRMSDRSRAALALLVTLVLAVWTAGCSSDGKNGSSSSAGSSGAGGGSGTDFVSDNPNLGEAGGNGGPPSGSGGSTSSGGSGTGGGGGGGGDGGGGGEAERAIEEADIIQVQDNRLYALSRYGGLSVIDVGERDQLTLQGRYKTEAEPFEMYVRGNIVLGLFNAYGHYVEEGDDWQWVESSLVLALDTSDPDNIRVVGESALSGSISDSRIVGDVLYVVGYQNGYCWRCDNEPQTTILSLDISDPSSMQEVDRLAFVDANDEWGWGRRSITVTTERMYVAGREYSDEGNWGSTIQVVDISDPAGDMVEGAAVEAEGEITSRWQMSEHEGVLRVISQPGRWSLDDPPVVQTFSVTSSQDVTALGRMDMVLPRPEQLRSVRFDGTRAYAITFERTDPLFTIDLSEPATPVQLGELEIPGWVYHMEPRGDRVLALGFDNTAQEGSLHVSIFDVSDMTNPTMVDRVNFGGDWADLAEDQDRIHKAFGLLEDLNLILVPFSGYSYAEGQDEWYGCGTYHSGVQLIDWNGDDLTKRGIAPSHGQSRRAFVHDERLFTVSDNRVETFDFGDRDAPRSTARLALARNVTRTAVAGDKVLRLASDWYTDKAELSFAPADDASDPQGLGSLDLENQLSEGNSCGGGFHDARVFASGDQAYVVYRDYNYGPDYYSNEESSAVAVVDFEDPTNPELVAHHTLDFVANNYWYGWGYDQVVSSGDSVLEHDGKLVFLRDERVSDTEHNAWIEVVHASDTQLTTSRLDLPTAKGLTGLHRSGGKLFTSHFEPLDDNPTRVRFYVDQIDLTSPDAPKLIKTNVPGSLLGIDETSGKLVTVGYKRFEKRVDDYDACWQEHPGAYFEPDNATEDYYWDYDSPGTCRWVTYSLHLVSLGASGATLDDTLELESEQRPGQRVMGDGVMFMNLGDYYSNDTAALTVLSGFAAGKLETATLEMPDDSPWGSYIYNLAGEGRQAIVSTGYSGGVTVIDATDAKKPEITQSQSLPGYVREITCNGGKAYISLGYDGVEVIDLR